MEECKYCDDREIVNDYRGVVHSFMVDKGVRELKLFCADYDFDRCEMDEWTETLLINNCPMCGRKL